MGTHSLTLVLPEETLQQDLIAGPNGDIGQALQVWQGVRGNGLQSDLATAPNDFGFQDPIPSCPHLEFSPVAEIES